MTQLTRNGRLVLERLVEYLGADVERQGRTVRILDCGNSGGMGSLGPLETDTWGAIGHLLTAATCLEPAGMGCTYEGIAEAVAFEFERDREGMLQWPAQITGTTDAMMSRLAEPARFDAMADKLLADREVAT